MIIIPYVFRTVVKRQGGHDVRLCTDEIVDGKHHPDDIEERKVEDFEVNYCSISSRKDVRKAARKQLGWCWFIMFFNLFAACFNIFCVFCRALEEQRVQLSLNMVLTGISSAFFVLFCKQVLHPIIHDMKGHWVDLRTGSSDLCDGITIKKG